MSEDFTLDWSDQDFKEINDEEFEEEYSGPEVDILDSIPPVKKSMVLFFLVDVSSSMKGDRIEAMNRAMRDVLPDLIGVGGVETDIKIAVLEFGSGWEWVTPDPVLVENFQNWKELRADGVTDFGAALLELNNKMSRNAFLKAPSLSYAPVVFLITDGYPTDNYKAGLDTIKANKWFKSGIKIALALGEGVDKKILQEFTEDPEFVVEAKDSKMLYRLVRQISVTSSQIGSSSTPVGESTRELTVEDVEETKKDIMRDTLMDIKQDIIMGDELLDSDFDSGW